jgi:hypothetical protein
MARLLTLTAPIVSRSLRRPPEEVERESLGNSQGRSYRTTDEDVGLPLEALGSKSPRATKDIDLPRLLPGLHAFVTSSDSTIMPGSYSRQAFPNR